MKHIVCAIYDSSVKEYLPPFNQRTKEEAIRAFRMAVNKPGHDFNQWPEDFTLFALGEFDSEKGTFENYITPERMCRGNEVLEQVQDNNLQLFPASSAEN